MRNPEIFQPSGVEDEIAQWTDWAFSFKTFMCAQDERFKDDVHSSETAPSFLDPSHYDPAKKGP